MLLLLVEKIYRLRLPLQLSHVLQSCKKKREKREKSSYWGNSDFHIAHKLCGYLVKKRDDLRARVNTPVLLACLAGEIKGRKNIDLKKECGIVLPLGTEYVKRKT
jgi:hypothetical protein